MRRLKVLMSAYACEPGKGSEPGVGWNMACAMARYHDVWVLTRANNRSVIEDELARNPVPGLRFVYYDLPAWARWWKRGSRGVRLYYYLWQIASSRVMKRLHAEIGFDIAHHATFAKYWAPAGVTLAGLPYVLGPVGGGESAPLALWPALGLTGMLSEAARVGARGLAHLDPLVLATIRRARVVYASTPATAACVRAMGARDVRIVSQVGCDAAHPGTASNIAPCGVAAPRFVSVGNMVGLKGFRLGLEAFAAAGIKDARYIFIGDGAERRGLERLARSLGVAGQVEFRGWLPRESVLAAIAESDVLVHPSLHDSGGFVCMEAMAAGKPVICLDVGGPAMQVTPETGFVIAPRGRKQVVADMAQAMARLAHDPDTRTKLGLAGWRRTCTAFTWECKARQISSAFVSCTQSDAGPE